MVKCWVCGNNVKPDTRYPDCQTCHGHVVTKDTSKYPRSQRKEKLTFAEVKRMMENADTYERRNGRIKQRRHGEH